MRRTLADELEARVARTYEEGDADADEFASLVEDFLGDAGLSRRSRGGWERRRKAVLRKAERILRDLLAGPAGRVLTPEVRGYRDYLASPRDVGRRVSEKTFFVSELLALLGDGDRARLRELVKSLAAEPLASSERSFVGGLLKADNLNVYAHRVRTLTPWPPRVSAKCRQRAKRTTKNDRER